jgi:hypothetical protein
MIINKICDHLTVRVMNGELDNNDLVQLIEHVGSFLNLKTIPDYAKDNKLSYNGSKNFRNVTTIFNTKFIIDNE